MREKMLYKKKSIDGAKNNHRGDRNYKRKTVNLDFGSKNGCLGLNID